MRMIPYAKPWITEDDKKAVADALSGPLITRGPHVEAFEKAVAAHCQAPFAVAFNSGTQALSAAYYAAHTTRFDRVITSPNTFIGGISGALLLGSGFQFADIERDGNLDLKALPIKEQSRGKQVLVPNHFAGSPLNPKTLSKLFTGPDDLIIEDAAHAFGARYEDGTPVGSSPLSAMCVFSFHPAKTITTGEGGVVVTHHEEYVEALYAFRNNGITYSKELHLVNAHALTGNFHMTEMQAALGLSQLERVNRIVARRKKLYHLYAEKLEGIDFVRHSTHSSHHLFCCLLKPSIDRQMVMQRLKEKGIGTQIHYIPLYRQPVLKGEPLTGCEAYYQRTLTLPLFYELKKGEVERIAEELKRAVGEQ